MPYPPPASVSARLYNGLDPAPAFPLCALGLPQDAVHELFGAADASLWWGESLEMGRVQFESKYCGAWRAWFESFALLDRVLAPAYCRAVVVGRGGPGRAEEVESVAHQEAASAFSAGSTSVNIGRFFCARMSTRCQSP